MVRSWHSRIAIFGALAASAAIAVVAIHWYNAKQAQTARRGATRFAAALVSNDPQTAPPGAGAYVTGVRSYFGAVTSAKVIGTHSVSVRINGPQHTRRYPVADLLLQARRGPAVIEVAFDNGDWFSERVSEIYEINPKNAPALSSADRRELSAALLARGGRPANELTLSEPTIDVPMPAQAGAPPSVAVPISAAPAVQQLTKAEKLLQCVQNAHGDAVALQKCS
jgi:hypothetical protein